MLLTAFHITILISLTSPLFSYGKLSPIVIIPGLTGSQLQAKLNINNPANIFCDKKADWYTIWLNFEELLPYVIDCFISNTKLSYNISTRTYNNTRGVLIRAPCFGSTYAIEYLDSHNRVEYFYPLVQKLVDFGYKRDHSLVGAPYDWRLGPNSLKRVGYYANLTRLIENTYTMNDNTAVTLICHSLGCPTVLYYLNNLVTLDWKRNYIHHLISFAGAWGGSIKTISGPISGDNFFYGLISPIKLRESQRTFESTYFLFPNAEIYDNSMTLVETLSGNYSFNTLDKLFNSINFPLANTMRNDLIDINKGFPNPRVPICCIHGRDVQTTNKMIYGKDFPDAQPQFQYGAGDGTVNIESLRVCTRWNNSINFKELIVPGKDGSHETILNADIALTAIKEIVQL